MNKHSFWGTGARGPLSSGCPSFWPTSYSHSAGPQAPVLAKSHLKTATCPGNSPKLALLWMATHMPLPMSRGQQPQDRGHPTPRQEGMEGSSGQCPSEMRT